MFHEIAIEDLSVNAFTMINKDWMLITAGDEKKYNTMTASWGGVGELWKKYVSFIFIRPQRYTLEFIQREEYYSICVLPEKYRSALAYCGAHSGRDVDKAKETGLTPVFGEKAPYFKEASLVFICKKMHCQDIDPAGFIDSSIDNDCYPQKDYHKMFIGDIVKVLAND